MQVRTHEAIAPNLCGRPVELSQGFSRVEMAATAAMAVDDHGLVHGGFVFGLADHAAMVAVNHPHVVLGAAAVRFTRPVKAGDALEAEARVIEVQGKKHLVEATVSRGADVVFQGEFTCFVLDHHVLDGA